MSLVYRKSNVLCREFSISHAQLCPVLGHSSLPSFLPPSCLPSFFVPCVPSSFIPMSQRKTIQVGKFSLQVLLLKLTSLQELYKKRYHSYPNCDIIRKQQSQDLNPESLTPQPIHLASSALWTEKEGEQSNQFRVSQAE